jgi:asparagine synthase (glutamine-hydrolysing)
MYLMARKIKCLGVKMVLSGEGADEMFGGQRENTRRAAWAESIDVFTVRSLAISVTVFHFAGYLYFHKCPSPEEFQKETVRKLKGLHKWDCLRANKSTAAWGVEARVPFLDREFLDYCMAEIAPKDKMCGRAAVPQGRIEKWCVREAFKGYLPESILWRQKEQFRYAEQQHTRVTSSCDP